MADTNPNCVALSFLADRVLHELSKPDWRMLGQHLRQCPSCREKYPAMTEALTIEPEDMPTLLSRGDALFTAGRLDAAEGYYRRVIETYGRRRSQELARVFYNLGSIREQLGDKLGALARYDEAYAVDTAYGPALAALGRLAIIGEEWEKALRIYRAILRGNLEQSASLTKPEVYYQLGLAHAKIGEAAKALAMFERGLELDPQSGRLRKAIEHLKDQ